MDSDINYQKAKYFYDQKEPIHIVTKTSQWINGYIQEIDSAKIIVKEFVKGETVCFIGEIYSIVKYEKKEEGGW